MNTGSVYLYSWAKVPPLPTLSFSISQVCGLDELSLYLSYPQNRDPHSVCLHGGVKIK